MRYPGAKKRLAKQILPYLNIAGATSYAEPFMGSAAIGISVLKMLPAKSRVYFADIDPWIVNYWNIVKRAPEELCKQVQAFTPSVDAFYKFQELEMSTEPYESVYSALVKLSLHAMSFGGLGVLAGGPIGGRGQKSDYAVGCRWSPKSITKQIRSAFEAMRRCEVTIECCRFSKLLSQADTDITYLDPPYVTAGPQLYKDVFCIVDHMELHACLQSRTGWVLSYDDHPWVRAAYSEHNVHEINTTTQHGEQRGRTELLIVGAT